MANVEKANEIELGNLINSLSPSEKQQFLSDVAHVKDASFDETCRKRALTYSPISPENSPAVLTFTDITVIAKNKNRPVLLEKCSGSITGGFWAIMGASGINFSILLFSVVILFACCF